jgi:sugar phosphate isomerase/epimerase
MLLGAMNRPDQNVTHEIEWMASMGLEFIDLTLEPPKAASWSVKVDHIKSTLSSHRMKVIGHTAFYLPIAHPFEKVRRAAVEELKTCISIFAELDAPFVNFHPDCHVPFHSRKFMVQQNLKSIQELLLHAQEEGIGLMVENIPGEFNKSEELAELLDPLPDLGLHLDIGHANLKVPRNTTSEILKRYGSRVRHVHFHDNKGGSADLHLPLGAGTMDLNKNIKALRDSGYDATITLEVFSEDRSYLKYSKDVFTMIWEAVGASSALVT